MECKEISNDRYDDSFRIIRITIHFLFFYLLESVKSPSFEVSHGKLATISLELGSKDKYPIIHPINYQKKGVDFPLGKWK